MPYLEIKTTQKVGLTLAKKILSRKNISAILTTGSITKKAKELFDQHGIAYAENIPRQEFMKTTVREEK